MKALNSTTNGCGISQCGGCRFYTPIGRRGGDCGQLGVPVKANWKACCFAKAPFQKVDVKPAGLVSAATYPTDLSVFWPASPHLTQPVLSNLAGTTDSVES
jgi:hypothetical protein